MSVFTVFSVCFQGLSCSFSFSSSLLLPFSPLKTPPLNLGFVRRNGSRRIRGTAGDRGTYVCPPLPPKKLPPKNG